MNFILLAVIVLGAIAFVAALILYVCAKKTTGSVRCSRCCLAPIVVVVALPDVQPWPEPW